jgi:hypothetical protein
MLNLPTAMGRTVLRLVAAAGLALILVHPSALAVDARPDFAGKLPAQVGAWKKPAKPALYDRKTLYDYIDGGAELYLAFGFERAVTFEYAADKDDEIKVDIFDMGSPRGAFGAFAHGRESIAVEVGQGSEYGGGLLTFWKHRWFISVLGYPETVSKRKAVYELARTFPRPVRRPPSLVRCPDRGSSRPVSELFTTISCRTTTSQFPTTIRWGSDNRPRPCWRATCDRASGTC